MWCHATCTWAAYHLCMSLTQGACAANLNLAKALSGLSPASSQNFVFFGPLGALLGKPGEKILPYLMGAALPLRQGRFPRLRRLHQNRNAAA